MAYANFDTETTGGFTQSSPRKNTENKSVVFPLTALSFIHTESNNKKQFTYKQVVLNTVVVCGRITNIDIQNDVKRYTINDSTGSVVVGVYQIDSTEENIEVGQYIKCVGKIKKFSQETYILASRLPLVVDVNHMMTHLIECAYALSKLK
ncbi:OB-fold nucleic acid binding domain containing protein [Entamoeba histolytica HM-1:IMSS-B]|uniref:OB-fold nucleic acid binding domain containing protein n=8 Tax=Entamoeba TaxID=5758 RepID=C4M8T1_ENTH1|nr:OB-fold nucleic acid binding domain containing protein [Entamoeba nuttalli P19]XP_649713.1 hypothetical protein EHI_147000 [Entamoeba histolytica HM-1:IMSS]EMD42689.1 OBfold nucleic acid binding domain containing protein [Entamoeba histolytica KU27]EMH74126.1 OB-fold nucleic acid binding domain containing protein [Entamoeba histolytica HM-1:IMSS-B]EMS14655.1 OB-fold nucleic acid binding domain containing protein [Entamoeba histolytica HM-3:IMSS]ENY65225.1 OB-fold nucleic acid binding domain|eukprot:XP_008856597.1 OB-fold nucleic acid binding domain containing protein [Entamoeba nuttalli P19]